MKMFSQRNRAKFWGLVSALFLLLPIDALVGGEKIERFDRILDDWADGLIFESAKSDLYLESGFTLDTWYYHRDDADYFIGLWFPDEGEHSNFSARASLELYGEFQTWLSFKGKFRWDDGVHPGMGSYVGKGDSQTRTDELYFVITLSQLFNVQFGEFTPLLSSYLERQDTWDNGLINAPFSYDEATSVADVWIPQSEESFISWRSNVNPLAWQPAIWSPLYTRGVSLFGDSDRWSYLVTMLNSNVSSRGDWWNDNEFEYPTFAGRLTFSPNPVWRFGLISSSGTYLHYTADEFSDGLVSLPPGTDFDDFKQTLLGGEIGFAKGKWEVWSEAFWVSYDVPNVSDEAEYLSYYLEARYKIRPKIWISARWNQDLFEDLDTVDGPQTWVYDRDRIDLGIGYRFSRHAQVKAQITRQSSSGPRQFGETQLMVSTTLKL